jgi:F-type H+-transporting ATPase subunit b
MLSSIEEQVVQAGLVDIDGTFLIQLVVFLLFFAIFTALVVKPLMRTYQMRFERMAGARNDAESFTARAAKASGEYETKIDEARKGSVHLRNDLKDAADEKAAALVGGVESESSRQLESGRGLIAEDAALARTDVDAQVEAIAELVATRVLGKDAA